MSALRLWLQACLSGAALLSGVCAAQAQSLGQTPTMIVNYAAGGPTDIDARILARHLVKHLPGVSNIIVRNVPGGAGNIGINQFGHATNQRDQLNIGFFTWNPLDQILDDPSLRIRYNDFKFVAGFRQGTILYVRRDAGGGMSRPADLAKVPLIRAGALSARDINTIRQRLALDLLGVKYETIVYTGMHDIEIGILRNDVQLTATSLSGWYGSVKPTLVADNVVMPLLQYDSTMEEGSSGRSPDAPDVPSFSEVYRDIFGANAAPSGPKWQVLRLVSQIMDSLYRTVFMPPGAPSQAVAELREGMQSLSRDPEFIAEYEKVVKFKPRVISSSQGERIINELSATKPETADFIRKFIAEHH